MIQKESEANFHIIFILLPDSGFRHKADRLRRRLLHDLVTIYGKYVQIVLFTQSEILYPIIDLKSR